MVAVHHVGFLDDVEVGDEFAVAGNEEAGAGGNLFAVGVGHDQQHDSRSRFLGERLEVNGLRLRADGQRLVGGEQRNSGNENSEHAFHGGRIGADTEEINGGVLQQIIPCLATALYR